MHLQVPCIQIMCEVEVNLQVKMIEVEFFKWNLLSRVETIS